MAPLQRQHEPNLQEVLQEPMVRQLMKRDRVSHDHLRAALHRAGFELATLD